MATQPPTLATIAQCLQQTLHPSTRKQAEQYLLSVEKTPRFCTSLLTITGDETADQHVRFAAAVLFKNLVRKYWAPENEDEANVIPTEDRQAIKAKVVDLMISLPAKLQLQISEGLAIVAKYDFPGQWPELIQQLNSKLSPNDYHVNLGVLQTAHTIFKRWRKEFRSNELFTEIKYVLDQFTEPYTQIFKATDEMIQTHKDNAAALKVLLPAFLLLTKIFYSLNCQDLPEYFEDHIQEFMSVFHRYLTYNNPLMDNHDDDEATDVEKIKAGICEIITLYTSRAEECFSPLLPDFVTTVWGMLTELGLQSKYDILASKAIGFLTTVVHLPGNRGLFANPDTLKLICEKVILPNMTLREADEELFEDDPMQYVVYDLESSDNDSRRRAAADLVRAFLEPFHKEITGIISTYVEHYLNRFTQNPQQNWKDKDVALFMVTAVSAVSLVARHGVTRVNDLVNVVDFFSKHILEHLQTLEDKSHPILKADAIKYVYMFRNQLSKEQLGSLLPFLCQHLSHPSPCVATYAAICLERIFFIKRDHKPVFTPLDIQPLLEPLFTVLFRTLEQAGSPEKMAEREHIMKLIMRVIIVAREQVVPVSPVVLAKLAAIVEMVSKNPSNPQFNHYLFESIAVLARFTVSANPEMVTSFEQALFPPFQYILQNDVSDFTPYAFQILSQLLVAHMGQPLPDSYKALFLPLLQPVLWENSGNIPALVRLVKAYLQVGSTYVVPDHLSAVLGIFQKLISSKAQDHQGFDLLNTLLYYSPLTALQPHLKALFTLILNRLQTRSTPKFIHGFIYFVAFFCCLEKPESTPQMLVQVMDSIQPDILGPILQSIILPNLKGLNSTHERKVTVVGYLRLLTMATPTFQNMPYAALVSELLINLGEKLHIQVATGEVEGAAQDDLNSLDLMDQSAFQTNYSRLATISKERLDPAPYVKDYRAFLKTKLLELGQTRPAVMNDVMSRLSPEAKAYLTLN
ncbi:importin-alpha export receptor [Dispira simplex]|nr:importin-alpha export receptor [Dispira simplex]